MPWAGAAAEGGDDVVVDAADAGGGVADVDDGVPGGVQAGERGADRHGFPGADFAGDHAEGLLGDGPGDAGGGLGVGGVPVQHAGGQVTAERHRGEPEVLLHAVDHRCVLPGGLSGAAVDGGELLLGGVEVAGQGGGAAAGVGEEDGGGFHGGGGVVAEVVAEVPGGEGAVKVAGDLGEELPEPGGGRGQGAEDVVGDGRLVQAGLAPGGPVQAADGLGGGAGQGDGVIAGELVQVGDLPEVIHGRRPGGRDGGWRGLCRSCRCPGRGR